MDPRDALHRMGLIVQLVEHHTGSQRSGFKFPLMPEFSDLSHCCLSSAEMRWSNSFIPICILNTEKIPVLSQRKLKLKTASCSTTKNNSKFLHSRNSLPRFGNENSPIKISCLRPLNCNRPSLPASRHSRRNKNGI